MLTIYKVDTSKLPVEEYTVLMYLYTVWHCVVVTCGCDQFYEHIKQFWIVILPLVPFLQLKRSVAGGASESRIQLSLVCGWLIWYRRNFLIENVTTFSYRQCHFACRCRTQGLHCVWKVTNLLTPQAFRCLVLFSPSDLSVNTSVE